MHQSQRVTSLYLPDTDKERLSRQANYGEFPGGAVVRTQALWLLGLVLLLTGELRSGKPCDLAKKQQRKKKKNVNYETKHKQ